jgi:gliding motility-associated-like protein
MLISPVFTYTAPGTYTVVLIIENSDACVASVTRTLVVKDMGFGPIPEIFTPNGDDKNDLFEIPGISKFPDNELIIYNRWGNLVYSKSNYNNTWDGSSNKNTGKLPAGTYYYILKLNDTENSVIKGYIQLIY